MDGNKEYYRFANNGQYWHYSKEQNSVVTYSEKRNYIKGSEHSYRYETKHIAPESILNKTAYTSFVYTINAETDEHIVITYNEFNCPLEEKLYNKRLNDNSYMDYTKTYNYNANYRLTSEDTTYCLYNIDDGEAQDHKYYPSKTEYKYDDYGQLIQKSSYFVNELTTKGKEVEEYAYSLAGQLTRTANYNSLESTKVYISERSYDSYGRILTETDGSGLNKYTYIYEGNAYTPNGVIQPNGATAYTNRDKRYRTTSTVVHDAGSPVSNVNTVTYDKDASTQYGDGSNNIGFGYNVQRRLSSVSYNSSGLYSIAYNDRDGNGTLYKTGNVRVTNAKSESFTAEHDLSVPKSVIKYGDNTELETTYLKSGLVSTEKDKVSGETVCYTYSGEQNLIEYYIKQAGAEPYRAEFEYRDDGSLSKITQSGKTGFSYQYYYDRELCGELKSISFNGNTEMNVNRDKQGRYTGRSINGILSESIEYKQISTSLYMPASNTRTVNRQSDLPSKITYENGKSISYTYDDGGNITNVDDKGFAIAYTYDKLNRLLQEDNKLLNRRYKYTYDTNGNITKRQECYYNSNTAISTQNYTYTNGRLSKFNNESIVYDAVGNPTTYRGKTLVWSKGKRLTKYNTTTFEYDGGGRRTKKGTTTYSYDYNDRLIASSDGLEYFYDHIGVAGFKYNGSLYYYRRDIQNNVTAILDSSGSEVVQYVYDAWGNHTVTDTSGKSLGTKNPFRYRSYFYDTETKLYYLKTRYYDPAVGRFINMDGIQYADPETINGLNLYAYCGNNPVNYVDPDGNAKWWQWLLFGVGAALVVGAVGVLAVASGGALTGLVGAIAVGAAKGALIGAATGSVLGIAGGAIYAGVTGSDYGDSILSGFLMGFGIGAITGAIVGGIVGGTQYTSAVSQWGAVDGISPEQNMIRHFNKHVINEGHKYLGKNVIQYTKNASRFFKANSSAMKLTKSGNYAIRAMYAGHKAGGFFSKAGVIFSFF